MIVYKGQGINWHPQSDSLGVSSLKQTWSTHFLVSGSCSLVESLGQLTCFIGCFSCSAISSITTTHSFPTQLTSPLYLICGAALAHLLNTTASYIKSSPRLAWARLRAGSWVLGQSTTWKWRFSTRQVSLLWTSNIWTWSHCCREFARPREWSHPVWLWGWGLHFLSVCLVLVFLIPAPICCIKDMVLLVSPSVKIR